VCKLAFATELEDRPSPSPLAIRQWSLLVVIVNEFMHFTHYSLQHHLSTSYLYHVCAA